MVITLLNVELGQDHIIFNSDMAEGQKHLMPSKKLETPKPRSSQSIVVDYT